MTDTVTPAAPSRTVTTSNGMKKSTAWAIAAAALLLGGVGGYAIGSVDKWWKWPSIETIEAGNGKSAADAYAVSIELEGKIKDGETFAPKAPFPIPVTYEELTDQAKMGALVTELKKMNEGGTYKVTLPPAATKDAGPPLGGQALVFDIKLVKVLDKQGYEAEKSALIAKQMEAMGGAPQGGPGANGGKATPETTPSGQKEAPAPKSATPAAPAKQ